MRESIEQLWLKLIRFYTFYSPIRRGKYRLYETALSFCQNPPTEIVTKTTDGRRLSVDLTSGMHEMVYFLGEYEKAVTDMLTQIIRPGDVCLDVGANFGWYTTLLHRLTSAEKQNGNKNGEVHAFEPLPEVFDILKQNWTLAGEPKNVFLNNLALGDGNRAVQLHRFNDLPSGHTSLSDMGKTGFQTFSVEMATLNEYLKEKHVKNVDFIKLDIEGAELMFLRGATALFQQKVPPVMMIEMAIATTRGFGYEPNDIIDFLSNQADYKYYWLDDVRGSLREFKRFSADDLGAHVLCVSNATSFDRIANLKFTN